MEYSFPLKITPSIFYVTFAFMQYKVHLFISHFVKTPQTLALFSSSNITSKKHLTQRSASHTLSWCHRRPAQIFLAGAPRLRCQAGRMERGRTRGVQLQKPPREVPSTCPLLRKDHVSEVGELLP